MREDAKGKWRRLEDRGGEELKSRGELRRNREKDRSMVKFGFELRRSEARELMKQVRKAGVGRRVWIQRVIRDGIENGS